MRHSLDNSVETNVCDDTRETLPLVDMIVIFISILLLLLPFYQTRRNRRFHLCSIRLFGIKSIRFSMDRDKVPGYPMIVNEEK